MKMDRAEFIFRVVMLSALAVVAVGSMVIAVLWHDPNQPTIGCTIPPPRVTAVGSVKIDIQDGKVICRCE